MFQVEELSSEESIEEYVPQTFDQIINKFKNKFDHNEKTELYCFDLEDLDKEAEYMRYVYHYYNQFDMEHIVKNINCVLHYLEHNRSMCIKVQANSIILLLRMYFHRYEPDIIDDLYRQFRKYVPYIISLKNALGPVKYRKLTFAIKTAANMDYIHVTKYDKLEDEFNNYLLGEKNQMTKFRSKLYALIPDGLLPKDIFMKYMDLEIGDYITYRINILSRMRSI